MDLFLLFKAHAWLQKKSYNLGSHSNTPEYYKFINKERMGKENVTSVTLKEGKTL